MKYRAFGATGISVSEIGLGCWQLANPRWGSMQTDEAQAIVRVALDEGCTFFDTAPGYGEGRSEQVLGQAIKSVRKNVSICTKFGHRADGTSNFAAAAARPALEESLRRLQTNYIDFYLVHNPASELLQDGDPLFEELERLKTEGKLRAYGVSLDSLEELELVIKHTRCEAVEVLFNVFHQDPLAAFQRAQAKGIGLIAKVPLDSGWLSGRYRGGDQFSGIRDRWSPEIIQRRGALVEQFAALVPPGVSLTHAALQFILAQAEVCTVIPGAKSVVQAWENFAVGRGQLSPDVVREIHSFWEREIRSEPLPW
jgi:aryl-alcohol dehydrogenase-like predicted oxidoreductase